MIYCEVACVVLSAGYYAYQIASATSVEMRKCAGNCVSVIIPMSSTGNRLNENTCESDYMMNKCKYMFIWIYEQYAQYLSEPR